MSTSRPELPLTFIDQQVDNGVATITINRPRSGNALNWPLLEQLRRAVRQATESPEVTAIVIASAGNSFVSGADVSFFVRCLESGELSRIVDCIRASQEVFAQITASPKPVVAAVQGAAVGGGVELALACHRIVATPRASFLFPETGLGILPSSGGTYRLPQRIGVPLAKWLVYTGHVLSPPQALKLRLIDRLVMPAELMTEARSLARSLCGIAFTEASQVPPVADEFSNVHALFARSRVAELRMAEPAADRLVSAALKAISSRSPSVLEQSAALLEGALARTLAQGEAAVLAAVPAVFSVPEVRLTLARVATQQRDSSAEKIAH